MIPEPSCSPWGRRETGRGRRIVLWEEEETPAAEQLEDLYKVIEKQRSQLSLAYTVLHDLGFDLADFCDAAD